MEIQVKQKKLAHIRRVLFIFKKNRTVDILKSVDMNGEVVQYLHSRRCLDLMVRTWKEYTTKGYLTFVDHREIMLGLDLLYYQFRGSAKIQFHGLFEEMSQASGYEELCKVLNTGPFNENVLSLKVQKKLLFIHKCTIQIYC